MPGSPRGDLYREQARRVRELARKMSVSEIREQMERIALDYENLARVADRLASSSKPKGQSET